MAGTVWLGFFALFAISGIWLCRRPTWRAPREGHGPWEVALAAEMMAPVDIKNAAAICADVSSSCSSQHALRQRAFAPQKHTRTHAHQTRRSEF